MNLSIQNVVNQIKAEFEKQSKMEVGKIVQHPDGRMVKITSGKYYSNGRLSNFWHWKEVMPDGSLGKDESGYGW